MEEKFFDFAKTKEALSQMSADLALLNAALAAKQEALTLERKNARELHLSDTKQITALKENAASAVSLIDSINAYINGVL